MSSAITTAKPNQNTMEWLKRARLLRGIGLSSGAVVILVSGQIGRWAGTEA
jgi:hypothetical protein